MKQLLTNPTSMKQSSYNNLIRTYKRLKSITKITGFFLIGKKKMLTSAKIDNFWEFFCS